MNHTKVLFETNKLTHIAGNVNASNCYKNLIREVTW